MSRRRELEARRAALTARCEVQRRQAALVSTDVERGLWPVDAAAALARRTAAHPTLALGALVAVVIVFRPQRLLRFVAWGVSAAVTVRRLSSLWRGA